MLTLSGAPSKSALTVTQRPLIPFIAFSPGMGLLGGQGAALYCGFLRLILTGPTASAGPPVLGASRGAVRAPSDKATDCPRKDRRVRVLLVPSSAPLLSAAALIFRAHDACDRDDADAGRSAAGKNAPHKLDEVATRRPRRAPCKERDRTIMSKTVGGGEAVFIYAATGATVVAARPSTTSNLQTVDIVISSVIIVERRSID